MNDKILSVLEFNKILDIIANYAVTCQARNEIIALKPTDNVMAIRIMLTEINEARQMIISKSHPPFHGVRDMTNCLKRLEAGGVLSPAEILSIGDLLRASRNLLAYAKDVNNPSSYTIILPLIKRIIANANLEDKIFSCILNEEEIADTASSTLFNIRKQINLAQHSIKEKLNAIIRSQKMQKYLQESLVTMREGRYVVPVKAESKSEVLGIVHDSSSSGSTLYIEPIAVVQANNEIKQLRLKERNEIEKILQQLSSEIYLIISELKDNINIITRLDVIFAKAKFGIEYNCCIPEVNTHGKINIIKGRHPLINKQKVVPIDVWLGDSFRSLVITGPNTGGKTVTLKTVGLFTLMMQAGIPVPSSHGTSLSVFKNVFADIGDEQNIQQSLSTFSSHMLNIVDILSDIDDSSLVLFDEIGAGTDPAEGSALAISILEFVKDIGACTIATTHYSDLKLYAMQTELVENASCEFDLESLKPTYKLLIGIPGKSNALAICERLGLNKSIIKNAKTLISSDIIRFEDIINDIENKKKSIDQQSLDITKYKEQIKELRDKLELEKTNLNIKKKEIIKEAKIEAREILLSAKTEVDEIISKIQAVSQQSHNPERNKIFELERKRLRGILKKHTVEQRSFENDSVAYSTTAQDLQIGTIVKIKGLDNEGTVCDLPVNDEVMIQVGSMKMKVKISNVKVINKAKKHATNNSQGIGKIKASKSKDISAEINLRGQTLDEAIFNLDKYIDDAALSGIKAITIIHGKGTGVLKSGIHHYLKTNTQIKSFRAGLYGEGGDGVTLAELH